MVLLCLAALCLPALANLPKAALLSEKPRLGSASFALASHRGLAAANALIAPGLCECFYDSGKRSRSTGKERDAETGLDYFGLRYMSATQGRFTSPDPLRDQHPEYPQSWNLYAYVRNNPLLFYDPNGGICRKLPDGNFEGDCASPGDELVTQADKAQTVKIEGKPEVNNPDFLRFFLTGQLPNEIRYGQNDPATQEIRSGNTVQRRRREYIRKGCPATGSMYGGHGEAYIDSLDHALIGPTNSTQFQVGGHGGSITKANGTVTYRVTNIAGVSSLVGHSTWGPLLGRRPNAIDNPFGPNGAAHNVRQIFEWSEADPCAAQ
ncbi:MAG: RHS repeat-associated core domain-containing protein [bacterium]